MMRIRTVVAALMLVIANEHALQAQDNPAAPSTCSDPREAFACQGEAVLTQANIDGAFSRIPEKNRLMFIRDGAKVDMMVKSLLRAELVALDAEKAGFAAQPEVQQRMILAARKELAEAWMEELSNRAPEVDFTAMAQEDYILNPDSYRTDVVLDVSHILIDMKERSPEEALALATKLKAELVADPSRFGAIVDEYSDDPGKSSNSGQYRNVKKGQMAKPFEAAAFAMKEVGEISDPVETEYGFHIIRLDRTEGGDLPPYDQVKGEAATRVKAKYLETYRMNYLQNVLKHPVVLPEGAVEVMARRYFGEDLEKAPIFTEDGPQ